MNKFGVDERQNDEQLEKRASEQCPKCGGKITRHGNVLICENCGTAPFEQEKEAP